MAHLIAKLTQRPRQSYKYHRIEQEAHYILFQVNEPCDCYKLKNQAYKEFDEGITKVKLLTLSLMLSAKLQRVPFVLLSNNIHPIGLVNRLGGPKQVILATSGDGWVEQSPLGVCPLLQII